ncbi:hypothetical protein [Nitrosomonas sp.]|uniref:hypothetical protein n=1 Tax=Nitrosomonas sp. TaxID=42353 RepID=UPI0037C55D84
MHRWLAPGNGSQTLPHCFSPGFVAETRHQLEIRYIDKVIDAIDYAVAEMGY